MTAVDRPPCVARTARTLALAALLTCGMLVGVAHPAQAAPADEVGALIVATNAARATEGCEAELTNSVELTRAAQGHADDMSANDYFSHDSQDGTTWDDRIAAEGYERAGGENDARGYDSSADVYSGWMESIDHRGNMVNCKFLQIGVGYQPEGGYWVADFGF